MNVNGGGDKRTEEELQRWLDELRKKKGALQNATQPSLPLHGEATILDKLMHNRDIPASTQELETALTMLRAMRERLARAADQKRREDLLQTATASLEEHLRTRLARSRRQAPA